MHQGWCSGYLGNRFSVFIAEFLPEKMQINSKWYKRKEGDAEAKIDRLLRILNPTIHELFPRQEEVPIQIFWIRLRSMHQEVEEKYDSMSREKEKRKTIHPEYVAYW